MSSFLNIGSSSTIRGEYKKPEWVNIDLVKPYERPKSNKYVVASSLGLPFRDNSFDEIRAIHCLEHIERKEHNKFYEEAFRVLKKDSSLFIEVPNFVEICNILSLLFQNKEDKDRKEKIRITTLSIYGKGRHIGDQHRWGFSKELLVEDLENYFPKVSIEEEMISNHYLYEPVILVKATK